MAEKLTPYGLIVGLIPNEATPVEAPVEAPVEETVQETIQEEIKPVEDRPKRGRPAKK